MRIRVENQTSSETKHTVVPRCQYMEIFAGITGIKMNKICVLFILFIENTAVCIKIVLVLLLCKTVQCCNAMLCLPY